ncbi:hypothetical protein TcWFU_009662 [Taenia crassiceps]|uniref:Uncharacterized protein n=1 Tax=Taenia crassiceps TaxID=6207 RepID=A0ABR4QTV5_9CEST
MLAIISFGGCGDGGSGGGDGTLDNRQSHLPSCAFAQISEMQHLRPPLRQFNSTFPPQSRREIERKIIAGILRMAG